jgi:hypothetical protein
MQNAVHGLQENDRRSEAGKGLGHFAAARSRTDHRQTLRQFCQRENGFVGEIFDLVQTGNRRGCGTRSGRNNGALEL